MATTKPAVSGPLSTSTDITLRIAPEVKTASANKPPVESSSSKSHAVEVNEVNSHPATEFHLFPKFPIELRLKIWKDALPGPKFIEIDTESSEKQAVFDRGSHTFVNSWQIRCDQVAPSLFFVTHEARSMVLEGYPLIKGNVRDGSKAVYCNFNIDVFIFARYYEPRLEYNHLIHTCLGRIRHIAVQDSVMAALKRSNMLTTFIDNLKALETVRFYEDGRDPAPKGERYCAIKDISETTHSEYSLRWGNVMLQFLKRKFADSVELSKRFDIPRSIPQITKGRFVGTD